MKTTINTIAKFFHVGGHKKHKKSSFSRSSSFDMFNTYSM